MPHSVSLLAFLVADNCKKLGLVFDDVVGIVEIINSRDIKVQVSVLSPDACVQSCSAPCSVCMELQPCLYGSIWLWPLKPLEEAH